MVEDNESSMYETKSLKKFEKNILNNPQIRDGIVDTEFRKVAKKKYLIIKIDEKLDPSENTRRRVENMIINNDSVRNVGYEYDEDDESSDEIEILVNNNI